MSVSTRLHRIRLRFPQLRVLAVALLLLGSSCGGVALSAATPSTEIPAGTSVTTGISMEPTVSAGEFVVYAELGEISTGDIIIYWSSERGKYVMHRVVEQTPRGYVTQGDARGSPDSEIVTEEMLVGKVLLHW